MKKAGTACWALIFHGRVVHMCHSAFNLPWLLKPLEAGGFPYTLNKSSGNHFKSTANLYKN